MIDPIACKKIQLLEDLTGYQIRNSYLGHGTSGLVFRLNRYWVIKLTANLSEIKAAVWVKNNSHPNLPKVLDIISYPQNYKAIVRESLSDIPVSNSENFQFKLKELERKLPKFFRQEIYMRKLYSRRKSKPIAWPALENLNPSEVSYLQTLYSLVDFLISKKVRLCDILTLNLGIKDSGELAIRDLGCLRVSCS